jgi:predicted acylesterase/phospholipase RssA
MPKADIIISPDVSHIGIFEFHRAKEAIQAGYTAANNCLPQILRLIKKQNDRK